MSTAAAPRSTRWSVDGVALLRRHAAGTAVAVCRRADPDFVAACHRVRTAPGAGAT